MKTRSYGGDRHTSLQRSADLLERFLTRLDNYRLLGAGEHELYERYLEQRSNFRLTSTNNPDEKRNIKIRRHREEKDLKEKLEVSTVV